MKDLSTFIAMKVERNRIFDLTPEESSMQAGFSKCHNKAKQWEKIIDFESPFVELC
jgi:hypothetical protein